MGFQHIPAFTNILHHPKEEMIMTGIVCAIRGGPDSQLTIEKAVSVAKQNNLPIYFLYVVNLDFLAHTASSRIRTISKELHQMGDFILLTAQAQAESAGVTAYGIVRHGIVGDEIIALCKDKQADYVMLGLPRGDQGQDVFTWDNINTFGQRIEVESGAEIIVVEGNLNE
jgi:nucleotide-binding universal stress UspA family protein